jgi:hypothetical protein
MNGGKRPGAGRPKGHPASFTEQAQAFRVALLNADEEVQEAIISAIIRNLKRGDNITMREILNRLLGPVKESIEMSGSVKLEQITGMQIIKDTSNGTSIQESQSKTNTSGAILD